jgi:sec-independent protein translocase protein TatC
MATVLRPPVSHDDRLSLTEHLDELRSRLIVCVLGLVVAFGFCFWQADTILEIVNKPLEQTQNLDGTTRSNDPLEQNARFQTASGAKYRADAVAQRRQGEAAREMARRAETAAERRAWNAAAAASFAAARASERAAAAEPLNKQRQPVTLGVAEPFTTTVSVAFYAGILLALPLILWQAYAFILPAFAPGERRVAVPLMALVPFLFFGGVAFAYFVVLPRAIGFLQNFNDDDFDILIQAREYYKFAVVFIGGLGIMFQIPLVVVAITRLGVLSPRQLQKNWGYVLLAMAVLAAVVTPTPDPLTMILAMLPLFLLFELSILLAAWLNRVSPPGHWWGEADDDDSSHATRFDDED